MRKILISVNNEIIYDQRILKTIGTLSKNGFDIQVIGRLKKDILKPEFSTFKYSRFCLIFNKGVLSYLEFNLRLMLKLFFAKKDILLSIDVDTIVPNLIISLLQKKKLILDSHELFSEVPELTQNPIRKKIWQHVERICIPKCDKVYTVCNSISDYYTKKFNITVEVIENFPYFKNLEVKNNFQNKQILYQGDLNIGRGLEEIITAMVNIDATLLIIGKGLEEKRLKLLTAQLNLKNKVIFLGAKLPKELDLYTINATIGLNLLQNRGLNYYYSLANKYFDYIQFGVPCISMNFPEYNALNSLYNCSFLIDDLNTNTLVNSINYILDSEEIYRKIQNNCKKARESLIWELNEKKLVEIFNYE